MRPGRRDKLDPCLPPGAGDLLRDDTADVVLVEAEKSALAITGLAARYGRRILPVVTGGVAATRPNVTKVLHKASEYWLSTRRTSKRAVEVVRYQPFTVSAVEGEIEKQSERAPKSVAVPDAVAARLAEPECGFTVSRAIVSAPGLFNAVQLHGTEPHAVSKPGFSTKFGPAPADATPKTNAATTTKPRSIVRTAVNIAVLLLPPLDVRILSSPRQGRQAARLDRLRHMRPPRLARSRYSARAW